MRGEDEVPQKPVDWRAILLGVLALAGAGILVALVSLQTNTDGERDRALALQAHTYEVIIRAELLSSTIAEAEASLGRYVVSADRGIGQEYSEAWRDASEHLNRLDLLTRDNPAQQRRIATLRGEFDRRGKELRDTALYSVFKRNRDALGYYYRVSDTRARAALNGTLDEIIAQERSLLARRKAEADSLADSSRTTTRVLAVFGLLTVLGATLLGLFTVQAIRDRALADTEAEVERTRSVGLQEAVAAATAQLRAEAQERERAEAQLRQAQKMEAVGQLTGGIAHDFNNMLAVVVGGLELAMRRLKDDNADAKRHIEHAMEGAERAAALTRRLLTFARSDALEPSAIDPHAVIEGMSELFDRTLGDGVRIETRDDGRGWRAWIDRQQLENALLNLAVNARDAMGARGTLSFVTSAATLAGGEIGACAAGDYVTVAVTDTGCGMTPDVLDRVFEPFFTTKPVGQGTGLGLSQIFGFVRQSGGEVAIRTAPGSGTTVTLYLPRYLGAAVAEGAAPAPRDEPGDGRPLAILVVEDDPRVLNSTSSALGELGHRVTECDDPLDAPRVIAAMEALDVIVSDVIMPGQTGTEMIEALSPRLDGIGVLFVTGYAGDAEAQAFGGHAVLHKPFTIAALASAVSDAAARARQSDRR